MQNPTIIKKKGSMPGREKSISQGMGDMSSGSCKEFTVITAENTTGRVVREWAAKMGRSHFLEGLMYYIAFEIPLCCNYCSPCPILSIIDPSGKVHPEIINENGNPSYKYFYISAEQGMVMLRERGRRIAAEFK